MMDLQGLRARGLAVSVQHSMGFVLMLGLGLSACGQKLSSERTDLQEEAGISQSYQEWCTGWELNCPGNEPGKTAPLTAAQFKALSTILGSALQSPSVFRITRDELRDPNLAKALGALKLDDVYQDVQARLDARQWIAGGLEQGAIVSTQAAPFALRSDSGLIWNLDAVQKVSLNGAAVQLSGFGLSADAAKESPFLNALSVAADGSFDLALSDRAVAGLPQDFALDNLLLAFGLDTSKLEGKDIALADIVQAGAPLVTWLNQSSRQIVLERSFFAASAGELGTLIPENGLGQNLGNLLSRLDKLKTASDGKSNIASVTLVKGATAKCDVNNGDVKVKFSADFGVKRIYQPGATTLGLELYGVEASAKKALGIPIKLKRVEVTADKITILDIPIIGKVDVKLDDIAGSPDKPTTLVCGA